MSDSVSFAEVDGQHVELLPARTVMSLFAAWGGGNGGYGGPGGPAQGGLGLDVLNINVLGTQANSAGDAIGGFGGSARGGIGG
jgi:hypothetical protein